MKAKFEQAFVFSVIVFLASAAAAAIDPDWQDFQNNPVRYMEAVPPKKDAAGAPQSNTLFDHRDITSGRYIHIKKAERNLPVVSRPAKRFFEAMVDTKLKLLSFLDLGDMKRKGLSPLFKLADLDRPELQSATLEVQPWSGDYWPIYRGGLGARYALADTGHDRVTWESSYKTFKSQGSLADIIDRGNAEEIDSLSPAEKYDLLLGNPRATGNDDFGFLTPFMWQEGQGYVNRTGEVERWMGFCHGWAPASLNEPRPVKVIDVKASTGRRAIHFYPDDLKGLSTLAWARGDVREHLVGGRCGSKNPRKDPVTGRLLDEECFDVNPGLWHLAIVNQLGLAQRGFVIDATYDYEVWNQPVFSYKMTYFNPQTGATVERAGDAMVKRADFTNDKFAKFRGAGAASFVGVKMTIRYAVETSASHDETDSDANDRVVSTTYTYDLEVDSRGEVIGGEWYQNAHPDFLWLTEAGSHPVTSGDAEIGNGEWTPDQPVPGFWKEIAIRTAATNGAPLARLVEPLMDRAAK